MGDAKQLIVKPISAQDANRIIKQLHYSGKVVNNSQLHLGVFMGDRCGGAMSFGPSLDKRKMLGLVTGTLWNEFLELNRMAFADWLPRNGESRCIGYAMRWIRKQYPWVKWVVSFADGTQCGDGTIYRASGFVLTGINESFNLCRRAHGVVIHKMTLESAPTKPRTELGGKSYFEVTGGKYDLPAYTRAVGGVNIPGFQLRYIYFLDPTARERLTVPILPFSEIDKRGAGMYKGQQRIQSRAGSDTKDTPADHAGEGGSTPTPALHPESGGE
jgi:hypothetical protein